MFPSKPGRPSHTARWHLAVFALALSLPVLAFVAFLLWQYTASERARLEGGAGALAGDVAISVDRDLTSLMATLEVLALSPFLRDGDLDAFHEQARQVSQRLGADPVLRDLEGQQLVDPRRAMAEPLPRQRLPIDERVIATRKSQVSDLFLSDTTREQQFAIVVPVIREDRVRALLSVSLPVRHVTSVLQQQEAPATWTIAVVDRQGKILARNVGHDDFVGRTASKDLLENTKGQSGTWTGTTIDGREVFGAYTRVRLSDWRIGVGVQKSVLNQSLTRSFWLLAGLGLALALFSTVLAAFFARRITQPMVALSSRAGALGRGQPVEPLSTSLREADDVARALESASLQLRQRASERDRAVGALSEETSRLDTLNRAGTALAAELDLEQLITTITESATRLTGAKFGAFFERAPAGPDHDTDVWTLASISGADPEQFTRFGLPRPTVLFSATFRAEGVVRCADVLQDPRYGSMGGMPKGHLPVRSYLAVPVISRAAETLGALLFGHPEPGRFGDREESLIVGFAGQASIALDNARLFRSVQREQDRFKAAVAAVRGVLWTNDSEGRMAGEQPGWSTLTGQTRDQYQGFGWSSAVHPDDRQASVAAWQEAVAEKRTFIFEHRVRRHDGVFRTFAIRAVPVIDESGEIREWVGVHTDITEQREAEAELKESNEEIQRYAYIVSHDLRAPLVNIMGFTSELEAVTEEMRPLMGENKEADRLTTDVQESLSFIKAAIDKMDGLINAILRLSREGRRNFKPEPLDMVKLLHGLADAQRHQADTMDAEVIVNEMPDIVADRLAIEQIFGNLIDNAIKYSAPGRRGVIEITGEPFGSRVRFSVRDNGRGIAPHDHARVFELFRRSGAQDKPGEGIGLAHVRALVRSIGGRIDLTSELGVGTTFTITLPAQPTRAHMKLAAE
ncbi:MAG: fhlA [Hyphomicrobiales bacterium]|nr:fhlA [Hyphomicrobiales bacterium]